MKNNMTYMQRFFACIFVSVLSACVTTPPPPPLPPTAHFDEVSGVLTVDCVVSVGDTTAVTPPMFSFSAHREIDAGEAPNFIPARYSLIADTLVAVVAPEAGCRNRAYFDTAPAPQGKKSVHFVLPDVLGSNGERYTLELANADSLETSELLETTKRINGNRLADVTITAGAKVSIPLSAPYDTNPVLYLRHGTGRHAPEITWASGNPLTLEITGVGPGTFYLTADFSKDVRLAYEETIAITVCSDDSDLDDCNSDVRDCNCLATDERLAAELAIREALFRDQLSNTPSSSIPPAAMYCFQIEGVRRSSDESGQTSAEFFLAPGNRNELYIDPPAEFMSRFADMTNVKAASGCSRRGFGGEYDLTSGKPALILVSGAISWQGDARVIIEGGYFAHGQSAAGELFTLELIDGRWQVINARNMWRS